MRTFVLILACIFLCTCKKGHEFDCFKSAGSITTQSYELEEFTSLKVSNKINLELVYTSAKPRIEITYNKNLISGIQREIIDKELIIDDNNRCNWVRNYNLQPKIRVFYTYDLQTITAIGAAKIFNTDTLKLNKITINNLSVEDVELTIFDVNGIECNGFNSGGFMIKGQAGYLTCTIDDASYIDTRNLTVDDLYIFHYSIRSSYIQSRDIMQAKLYGLGDVYINAAPSDTTRWRCCKVLLERFGSGEFK